MHTPTRNTAAALTLALSLTAGACGGSDSGGDGMQAADGATGASASGDAGRSTDAGSSASGTHADGGAASGSDAGADGGGTSAAADTWTNYAGPFFASYCTECHAGGTRDYRTIAHVQRDASLIRCGVSDRALTGCGAQSPAPRQFPIGTGAKPSDADRARLVRWIDAGLAE